MSRGHHRDRAAPEAALSGWDAGEALASTFYFDRHFNRRAVKLLPGEYYTTHEDMALTTVLGSCVSACLRDAEAGVGGMNHFMLPDAGSNGASARYGSYAMELLVNELLKQGARRGRLEAKVFGGGHVVRSFSSNSVGSRNVDFVRSYLATERIPIIAEDLGDRYARKLCYLPISGQAFMRRIESQGVVADLAQEQAYGSRLQKAPVAGDIELFD